MQPNRSVRSAAHASIAHTDHVAYSLFQQLSRQNDTKAGEIVLTGGTEVRDAGGCSTLAGGLLLGSARGMVSNRRATRVDLRS